ncbi:MAG: translation initiation factor IF-3 [Gammaproteobacteria bacterium]|nr:translation initiation factor IF-3 [Gammaproteobacteria bacterium]
MRIKDEVRVNGRIRAPKVRLVGPDGEQIGVMSSLEALREAEQHDLDLVEIAPQASPPVCKIMDYGKYKFEQSKKKKKSKQIQLKEVKMRPGTDIGDYRVKLDKAIAFLAHGDKVKFTIRFRGREMAHKDLGAEMLNRIKEDISEHGEVEQTAKLEGRQMIMVVGPRRK